MKRKSPEKDSSLGLSSLGLSYGGLREERSKEEAAWIVPLPELACPGLNVNLEAALRMLESACVGYQQCTHCGYPGSSEDYQGEFTRCCSCGSPVCKYCLPDEELPNEGQGQRCMCQECASAYQG